MKKRGRLLFAVLICGLGSIFIVWRLFDTGTPEESLVVATDAEQKDLRLDGPDSDSDGLLDWQETLWHTDHDKKDTDGDGTNDGTEVALGRDPVKKGPGDALVTATEPKSGAATQQAYAYAYSFEPDLGNTVTDKIALNLTANYIEAKAANSYDSQAGEQITNKLVDDALSPLDQEEYAQSDLRIVEDLGESRNAYLDDLASLLLQYRQVLKQGELEVFQTAAGLESLSVLTSLSSYASGYRELSTGLLGLRVPESLAASHLKMINGFHKMDISLMGMSKSASDPLQFVAWISTYKSGEADVSAAVKELTP